MIDKSYVISFVAVVVTSVMGSYYSAKNTRSEWSPRSTRNSEWYRCIRPAYLTPPGWVFPIVWTVLYFTLFLVLARAIQRKDWALCGLMAASLVLNVVWCKLYFGERRVQDALWAIGALVALALAMVAYRWWHGDVHVAKMLVPYTAWLLFATLLNYKSVPKLALCAHLEF